ncbi:transmembrane protein 266 [Poecilia latipinna]|uniref:transmembrane protein 266 n=1 Tax=Poecilia latipinna TaxID=48699 RepID=UPI00072E9729|nr:PREDICTED: transmembrane protein C15orf27 homolog [Poecilia latipinna]XP_014885770.1 PREDICTED: transmembrane protein C15orf27 homolog [Poecilia latipinna]
MSNTQAPPQGGASDLEVISQQVEEDNQCVAPVQLVNFTYRDLPLAALDISLAGSQLISNPDEEDNRDGSNWLKPCCGRRAALWQVCLLSAGFNCFLVACVILVVLLLTVELLIDIKLLQFNNASQFASIIHWISLAILSVFFTETVFRIVVLGIWDYIENKVEVFDGAVIVLSLAPMVASTVANGPSSPWDAIGLIISLRIWRVKRIIDAYVLQVKVEMELEIQQYEKAKAVREEQLDRLTQICQEQAFEIRQLRAHLAQQDLDLVAEREAAMQIHHMWGKQSSSFQEVDGLAAGASDHHRPAKIREPRGATDHHGQDDMNNYISQYYSEPSSDMGIPDPARVITTAAIDVHLPNNPSQLPSTLVSADAAPSSRLQRTSSSVSEASTTAVSRSSFSARQHSISSHTLGSSMDCSSTVREASTSTDYSNQRCYPPPYSSPLALGPQPRGSPSTVVQELLYSLSEDSCLTQKGLDPVNLKPPSPTGSTKTSPELERRLNIYNKRNQESRIGLHGKPVIHLQGNEPLLEEKYRMMGSVETSVNRLSEA